MELHFLQKDFSAGPNTLSHPGHLGGNIKFLTFAAMGIKIFFMRNKILCLILTIALAAAGVVVATKAQEVPPAAETEPEELPAVSVGIAHTNGLADDTMLSLGFRDALTELYGDRISFDENVVTDLDEGTHILDALVSSGDSLIYTTGETALSAAVLSTATIPIVATGITDFRDALGDHYKDPQESSTGINVTGVSSYPDVAAQLSLMIEATDQLDSVGLLYSPDDPVAISLNRSMEHYLDEAGIPWKEYILPSDDYRQYLKEMKRLQKNEATEEADAATLIMLHGMTFDEVSPRISLTWQGPKGTVVADRSTFTTDLPDTASLKKVIRYASDECSALYIPTGANIAGFAEKIAQYATKKGVTTVGGDMESGRYTMVTLYQDVYDMGYRAGLMAYEILEGRENASSSPIRTAAPSSRVKLYQDLVASQFGKEFPKSFSEYDDFLNNYKPGTYTTRASTPVED